MILRINFLFKTYYDIPNELLDNILDVTHIKTIGSIDLTHIFSSSEQLKCLIASLIHDGARLDRDENHVRSNSMTTPNNSFLF